VKPHSHRELSCAGITYYLTRLARREKGGATTKLPIAPPMAPTQVATNTCVGPCRPITIPIPPKYIPDIALHSAQVCHLDARRLKRRYC